MNPVLSLEPDARLQLRWSDVPTEQQLRTAKAIPGARAIQGGYEWGWWERTAREITSRLGASYDWKILASDGDLVAPEGWTWTDPDVRVEWRSPTPPRPHQLAFKAWRRGAGMDGLWHPGCLLEAGLGCLAGDTEVVVTRGSTASSHLTMAQLYRRWHGLSTRGKHLHKPGLPTSIRALVGDELRLLPIRDVLSQGERECIRLTLDSGREIVLTPDHLVRTPMGWEEAGRLKPGESMVFTNGFRSGINRSGSANPRWRGGQTITKDGYVNVWAPGHPYAKDGRYVLEHRLVMEEHLGRYLKPDEVIHHRNGVKADNRLENLELKTHSQHMADHGVDGGYRRLPGFLPKLAMVVSVEPAGVQPVYDLVMDGPWHNFVANGIVVHNCGKTLSAIEEMLELLQHRPRARILVLCLNSLIETTWATQIAQHAPDLPFWPLNAPRTKRLLQLDDRWHDSSPIVFVHSIEDLHAFGKTLAAYEWDMIVIDETSMFRTAGAKRTGRLTGYQARPLTAPFRLGLSGLPMIKQATDLYPLLRWLGAPVGNKQDYLERFMVQVPNTHELKLADEAGLLSLLDAWRFQVPKGAVLQIPRSWHYERIELAPWQRKLYKDTRKELLERDAEELASTRLEELMRLAKVTAGFDETSYRPDNAKLDHLVNKVVPRLGDEQAIIWVRFREEAIGVIQRLPHAVAFTGALDAEANRSAYLDFTEGRAQFFVSTLSKGARGLNLPMARHMVYLTQDFDTDLIVQSRERNVRLTTLHENLTVTIVEAEDSVDQKISEVVGDDVRAAARLTSLDVEEVLGR